MDDNEKNWVVNAVRVALADLVKQLNKNNEYIYKRFDDMEKRLEAIEDKLNIMGKDTKIIPDISRC